MIFIEGAACKRFVPALPPLSLSLPHLFLTIESNLFSTYRR
jgi:hypothetical protein